MTKRQIDKLITTIASLILVGIFGYGATSKVPSLKAGEYYVSKAVDGDTVEVKTSTGKTETVRFIGIDTPETHDPRKAVQCFGTVAAAKTKQLVEGKTVRLETDPSGDDHDKYKRLLRYVYLGDTFINQYLVQQGYAFAYTVFPNSKLDEFRTWEKEARENNRGLWAGCSIDESNQIKQTNNAN